MDWNRLKWLEVEAQAGLEDGHACGLNEIGLDWIELDWIEVAWNG